MQDLQTSEHDFKVLSGLPSERPSVPFFFTSRTGPDKQYSWMYIDKSEISSVPTHLENLADHDRKPKGTGDGVRIHPYSPADSEVNTAEINRPCPRNFT
ncbi:hypothetical protein [Phaeobacter sp. JL2872]|uniref:hypothetical protein n=1 Tax=Phaeobacter sp. JL2872 TaxID=2461377 RepID=UPI001FAF7758|nr:hypothetical protein [Phaeobacter sp. JL2872]